jgi:hypothetical protein
MQGAPRSGKQGKTDADLRMGVLGERRPLECFAQVGRQGRFRHGSFMGHGCGGSGAVPAPILTGTPIVPASVTSTRPLVCQTGNADRGKLYSFIVAEGLGMPQSLAATLLRAFFPD